MPLKGTPAIADEYMQEWMECMFADRPMPEDATGVNVSISILDPNNNYYDIGTVTSDITGKFGYSFTPEVSGDYKIIASFAGSKSYGPSFATTYISVDEAPQDTPQPTASPAPMTDTYVLGIGGGAIIAIVAVGLVIMLMLRKR